MRSRNITPKPSSQPQNQQKEPDLIQETLLLPELHEKPKIIHEDDIPLPQRRNPWAKYRGR